jgi:DNA-binding NarL/FixJ family response regulator
MTSAFVVARTPALRAGLRGMLESGGVHPLGDAANVPDSATADVLVVAVDVPLDELDGLERLGQPVVLLSEDRRAAGLLQASGLPGWAVLPADAGADQLATAANAAALGLVTLPAEDAGGLMAQSPLDAAEPLPEALTPRELEVLQLISHGLSNKMIARQLRISEHTVKFHVSSTYAKLGAASRTEAVSLAARRGLISL